MFSRHHLVRLALLAMIVVTSAGCSAVTSSSKNDPTSTPIPPPPIPEKPTYNVQRGLVVDSLSFTGRVAPAIEEELFFRTSGRVKTVYVERNDDVEEGTLLAELENDDLKRQLQQSEIELETAELNLKEALDSRRYAVDKKRLDLEIKRLQIAKSEAGLASLDLNIQQAALDLQKAKDGPSAEDIEIAKKQVESAQNSLWGAQASRDSTCGRGPGADCDGRQATVLSREVSVEIARINLQKLTKPATPEELSIAEASYRNTIQRRKQAEIDIEIQMKQARLTELDLEALESDLDPQLNKAMERAKLSVERLTAQVDATTASSPISGKVTSVSAYEGREIQAYRAVFIVADEAKLEITAEPMSSQLQRLAEGMDAGIILSAYPGKELPAEILQLPYPYGKGGGATVEEADKLTHLAFDPGDLDIEAGDLVKVIVTLEEKSDALWLPPAAIRTFAGRKFVVVEEEGRQRRVDVTIGIESLERVEILDGLEDGQVVVGQ